MEKEDVTAFMSTMSSTCYIRLIGHTSASLNLVQTEELIEDRLKTDEIKDYQMLFKQWLKGVGETMKKAFTRKKSEKNENEVHAILGPTPQHQ